MGSKGAVTKNRIIKTARMLFRLNGFGNTSIDDICRESGVTRGNLYFYFRSKEALARAAIEDSAQKKIQFFESLMEDEPDPLRKIELLIDGITAYYVSRGSKASCLFGTIAQEVGDSSNELAEATNGFFTAWDDLLTGLFDEAKATGIIEDDRDSEALSYLLISSLEGALILYKASKDVKAYTKTHDALKAVLMGLRR